MGLIELAHQIDGVPNEVTVGDLADNDDPILAFKFTRADRSYDADRFTNKA